jgi:hypothetical protein
MPNSESNTIRIELRTHATACGNGPYHPAIHTGVEPRLYWPNVTFETREEAIDWAAKALRTVREQAEIAAQEWNVWKWRGQ